MTGYLLDTNLLIAAFWPGHVNYRRAAAWFDRERVRGWATCPITEAGFVRILSNPAFSDDAVAVPDAIHALRTNTAAADHLFWPDEFPFVDAVAYSGSRLLGHQQTTDAYLLGLALRKGGRLATLDRGVAALVGADSPERSAVNLVD
jgi:toxin-antitoxin system PIN domain toxin